MKNCARLALAFAVVLSGAGSAPAENGSGVLKQVGALHCTAREAEGAATTRLRCRLRLSKVDVEKASYEGEMYGRGLHLVDPGGVQVLWNVLAPTRLLEPAALAGDYDIVSKHGFKYSRSNPNLLIGGMDDVVGLELVAPTVDAIDASTRLTLRQAQ